MLKIQECFPGALDVWDLFYLFRVVGGGVEGSLEKTSRTLDDLLIWGCRDAEEGIEVVVTGRRVAESITTRFRT